MVNKRRGIITPLVFLLSISSAISVADQKSVWQFVCKNKLMSGSGCQAVSAPSTVDKKTVRLLVRLSKGRPHVVILSSSSLYVDSFDRGDAIIKIDSNEQLQFKYVQYGDYPEKGEANVLVNAADTPLLSQMRRGLNLTLRIQYIDSNQHVHEIGLLGFTRAFNQL